MMSCSHNMPGVLSGRIFVAISAVLWYSMVTRSLKIMSVLSTLDEKYICAYTFID